MPAFVTSELKTAFQIGFLIFIPFVIIDLVVASVLMSMGMMMLSPMIISLPFKLMLFVLVDGWSLIMGTLASSFPAGRDDGMTPDTVIDPVAAGAVPDRADRGADAAVGARHRPADRHVPGGHLRSTSMTLSFIPKLLVLLLSILIAGPWMLNLLLNFTQRLYLGIPG